MGYEKRQFLYGMDLDTEERLIQPGFSRKNVNVRIGSSTDNGVYSAENIQGNTFIPNTELPSGTNKVIGSCWDKLRDLSYYFVYNSEGSHGIFEYNHVRGKIDKVMIAAVLNFQSDELVTGHNVVEFDKDNHLLYFTDGFNPPRKINIEKSKNGDYLEPIKEEVIDAIKYPPLKAPTFVYDIDQSKQTNYLLNKSFQFKALYLYDDQEQSAFSPISTQAVSGNLNIIRVTVPKGGDLVIRVLIACRIGNLGDFFEISDQKVSEYDKDSDGNYLFDFKNEKAFNSISLPKSNKLFDSLPQVAKAQEYIEGNRISYGNIIEGYDNVDVEYDLNVTYEQESDIKLNTIKGFLRIGSPNNLDDKYRGFQPIHSYKGKRFFGGFSPERGEDINYYTRNEDLDGFEFDLGGRYHQNIPLGGFVLYLAGTDYYCVSKQVNKGGDASEDQDSFNVYNSSTKQQRNDIRNDIEGSSSGDGYSFSSRVFSTWQIDNIPDGDYILRVASHLTTRDELLDPNRSYQKTSTFVNRISPDDTLTTDNKQEYLYEKRFRLKGGQIEEGTEVVIADLSSPSRLIEDSLSLSTKNIAGYLCDFYTSDPSNPFYTPTNISDALGQKRVEKSLVRLSPTSNGESLPGINSDSHFTYTDHNGFFFKAQVNAVNEIQCGKKIVNLYHDQQFYDIFSTFTTLQPGYSFVMKNDETKFYVAAIQNEDLSTSFRTNIVTKVMKADPVGTLFADRLDEPLSGISVVNSGGDVQRSSSDGSINMIIYAEGPNFSYYTTTAVGGILGPEKDEFPPGRTSYRLFPMVPGNVEGYFEDKFNNILFQGSDISSSKEIDIGEGVGFSDMNDFKNEERLYLRSFNVLNKSRLKNGGVYNFGIVYYDKANRSGTTNSVKELVLPFETEVNPAIKTPAIVSWEIKSLPPSWATHYQFVRTKNTSSNSYLQWFTSGVTYSGNGGSNFSDSSIINLDITNLTDEYKTENPSSVLVYDFTTGDRIRIIKDVDGNYFSNYIDLEVLSFSQGVLKVKNDATELNLILGFFFEIYSPKLESFSDIYYEIGACYDVLESTDVDGNLIKYHQGFSFDQDPLNPSESPAKGVFQTGDTYYRKRNISDANGVYTSYVYSSLYSDFWYSEVSDIGRPNIVDKNAKRVNRITTIYYSDRFVPETNINGLNTFFDTAFETFDRKYGSIQKLFSQDKRLDCYQEIKTGKILVEENVIFDQFDQGTIASSSKVLSKIIYYKGDYGTLNPESFVENEGRRYWFDVRNGKVLRLSNDGITPLSDKNMHGYFESKSNFYSAFNLLPEVWGVFDENFDEYIIAFGSVSRPEGFTPDELALVSSQADQITETKDGLTLTFDILYSANSQGVPSEFEIVRDLANGTFIINSVAGDVTLDRQKLLSIPPETLGFSEKTGYWTSFYSYAPECMVRIGVDFLSFKNGQAYLHNTTNAKRNSFYGEERGSEVWAVFNQNPSNVKVFQALSEESDSVWQVRDIFTQGGQRSNLNKDDFSVAYGQGHTLYSKENIHYAPFWKDENTPNVDNPLIEGDSLRDVSILVKLINDSTKEERLFAASINYSLSERSNR